MAEVKIRYHPTFWSNWKRILAKLPDGKSSDKGEIVKSKNPTKADYKKAKNDLTYNIANNNHIKGKEPIQSTKKNVKAFKCHLLGNKVDNVEIAWRYYSGIYNKVPNQKIAMILNVGGHEILDQIKDMNIKLYENEMLDEERQHIHEMLNYDIEKLEVDVKLKELVSKILNS